MLRLSFHVMPQSGYIKCMRLKQLLDGPQSYPLSAIYSMAAVILSLFQVNTVEELGFDYVLVISFHIILIFVLNNCCFKVNSM